MLKAWIYIKLWTELECWMDVLEICYRITLVFVIMLAEYTQEEEELH